MGENNNISGSSPQASPKPHGRSKETPVWSNMYNSALMGGNVPSYSIGTYLSSQNVNEKEPNKRNWY